MKRGHAVYGAFATGQTPTIACFNQASTPLGMDVDKLLAAMQKYVDTCVAPVWGTPARLLKTTGFLPGAWAMVFLDRADAPGALAYHDLTPDGLPLSKVFVETILDDAASVSVAASHELVEMLVDPAINLYSIGPNPRWLYAYESADPVEDVSFAIDGIAMTDFVYPSYFESFRKARSTQFDYAKKVTRPFQLLKGGYQIIFKNGKETQIFGSKAKAKRFVRENRRGHRSEIRRRRARVRRSKPDRGRLVKSF